MCCPAAGEQQAWHTTIELRDTDIGKQAVRLFQFGVQGLLGGDLIIHKNNPRPGRLALEAAAAAGVAVPSYGKGGKGGKGKGAGGGKGAGVPRAKSKG